MSELSTAIDKVRLKIARYKGKQLNEQNTKTALIDPILRALGWDVGDLEQVEQEYKRRPRDKPVDYALLVLRIPRLFVEAKALGQDLSDRKWANQIMGYATVAGVEWVVITNGDEYRIYNACVAVPVEEKLFRKVCVTDKEGPVQETLALISKDRISDNEIEIQWNAHFVDRQVHSALEKLFASDPDPSLVRLVKKRAKELSSKDIRASLRRAQVQFDFPVQPSSRAKVHSRKAQTEGKPKRSLKFSGVKLNDLIRAGLLKPPLKLTKKYKGHDLEAELLPNGMVRFQGNDYRSFSTAAIKARATVLGEDKPANGWYFWQYRDEAGKILYLEEARQAFLRQKQ